MLPDSRPNVIREDVPRRNYVESEMGPTATDLRPPPRSGRAFQEIYMDQKPERIVNDLELEQLLRQEGPVMDAKELQKQMYKGRPSHEAEQAKLFPKVNEAVKGRSGPLDEEQVQKIMGQWNAKSSKPVSKPRLRILKDDGTDVTMGFGTDEELAGMTKDELQKMVDQYKRRYKVVEE
jgi:hypothetical protein